MQERKESHYLDRLSDRQKDLIDSSSMYALTIKQPWLWAITDLDKRIENRRWLPSERHIGTRIALHAGMALDIEGYRFLRQYIGVEAPSIVARGSIVATAVLLGIWTPMDDIEDRWYFGPYGWILADVKKLCDPIPAQGKLGLWPVIPPMVKLIKERTPA